MTLETKYLAFFLFQNHLFGKNSFRNMIRVSNSLDPDQARHSVGADLGLNCLQKLSADKARRYRVKSHVAHKLVFFFFRNSSPSPLSDFINHAKAEVIQLPLEHVQ